MTKKFIALSTLVGILFSVSPVLARPSFEAYTLAVPGSPSVVLTLPNTAADASPTIVPLGLAVDPVSGQVVEGYAFVHYKNAPNHKPGQGSEVITARASTNSCYTYLAKGAKWKTVEPWVMNPSNTRGLDVTTLFANQTANLVKWEDAADGVVGNGVGVPIFGDGVSTTTTLVADTVTPDSQNEVYFGNISSPGAIAVTIVWGIFGGPISQRQLVEWDQVYDQTDFDWSLTGEAGKMDFGNIAIHEDGHGAGMGHPSDSCTEETMYRFASFGETKKRDLNIGDITGINLLY